MNHRLRALQQQIIELETALTADAYRGAVAAFRERGEVPTHPLLREWLRSWRQDYVQAWSTLNVDVSSMYPPLPEET